MLDYCPDLQAESGRLFGVFVVRSGQLSFSAEMNRDR